MCCTIKIPASWNSQIIEYWTKRYKTHQAGKAPSDRAPRHRQLGLGDQQLSFAVKPKLIKEAQFSYLLCVSTDSCALDIHKLHECFSECLIYPHNLPLGP